MKKRIALTVSTLALAIAVAIGGTLAYLTATTGTVTNTFTFGNVAIDLTETALPGGSTTANTYHVVPGNEYTKDPTVTVAGDSEACYLFVKVEETSKATGTTDVNFFDYAIDPSWTPLEEGSNIYYRSVDSAESDQSFGILVGNQFSVSSDVTSEMIAALDGTTPTLTFTAYAIQQDTFANAATAWNTVFPSPAV